MEKITTTEFNKILQDYEFLKKTIISETTEQKHLETCENAVWTFVRKHGSEKTSEYWAWVNSIVGGFAHNLINLIIQKRNPPCHENVAVPLLVRESEETNSNRGKESSAGTFNTYEGS